MESTNYAYRAVGPVAWLPLAVGWAGLLNGRRSTLEDRRSGLGKKSSDNNRTGNLDMPERRTTDIGYPVPCPQTRKVYTRLLGDRNNYPPTPAPQVSLTYCRQL